ncbi:MAG: crotonase/enoyl-CoA hydratase family protein [Salinarimonas sp.]|nr:crotonase/enoyl-CoA hydratase family protein [Salinarimonas sp.]
MSFNTVPRSSETSAEARPGLPLKRSGAGIDFFRRSPGLQPRPTHLDSLDALKHGNALAPEATTARSHALADSIRQEHYEEIEVHLDVKRSTYWCHMVPSERPTYTPALLRGLSGVQESFQRHFSAAREDGVGTAPFRYIVIRSRHPGVFNLGGDLSYFSQAILAGDRDALHAYATACIDVVYANYVNYELPVVTIGLAEGSALGGGFEALLSCDVIVAEKGTRFGFPEVLFNLFPGMGAFSFLCRRLGSAEAEQMINSGETFTAEELYERGIIHVLAEPGEGESAVQAYTARNLRRHNAHCAMYAASRRADGLPYEELADIVTLWVETAMQLTSADLRKMTRILEAQHRREAAAQAEAS